MQRKRNKIPYTASVKLQYQLLTGVVKNGYYFSNSNIS